MITYRQAMIQDIDIIAQLGLLLYSDDNTFEKLCEEATDHMQSGKWVIFLAFADKTPIGICEISLRTDYVEGTEGGPVGYIEGIYVLPEYRNRHIAKKLVLLGENWSREQGCIEFASDCKLKNIDSLQFHLKIGFEEAGRQIHFVKRLKEEGKSVSFRSADFWTAIDDLIGQSEIIIDRPQGSKHPRYDFIYPMDYGYLKDTTSPDGGGIDVWRGSLCIIECDAIICTVDLLKKDSEIKLLIGCTEDEKAEIMNYHNDSAYMKGVMIRRKPK